MIHKIIYQKHLRLFMGIGLAWFLLWIIPWGKLPSIQEGNLLALLTDMIRLGIALGLFIFPGALLYLLLKDRIDFNHDPIGIIPIGFALSVFLIGVIGLIGRLAGFSFESVKSIFVVLGGIEIFLLVLLKDNSVISPALIAATIRTNLKVSVLLLALIIATLVTFQDALFFTDDTTYLAYLTNWQYSDHLGFMNIIHDANILEIARFWLALYPMGQALLSDISGVPGLLLLGNYLEPFLVPLAVLTSYWFGRTLGLTQKAAGFAALIQVTLYTWMLGKQFPVGFWFYNNMSEDKVSAAFLLSPVFFAFVINLMNKPTRSNAILTFISGVGITLTHPVILFFACAIAAGIGFFSLISKRVGWKGGAQLFVIIVLIMLPYAVIRLSDSAGEVSGPYDGRQASTTYEIERYTNVVSDVFYGLNPKVLMFFDIEGNVHKYFQYVRILPIIILILSGILAFLKLKNGLLYEFVFACVFLVFFATIPYTGWILGYFVSARLISRISWFAPYGLGSVLIIKSLIQWAKSNQSINTIIQNHSNLHQQVTLFGLGLCLIFVSPVLLYTIAPQVPAYFETLNHNKQLAQSGAFIDRVTKNQVISIALDYWDTQMLPGVSAHSSLISFREELDYNGHNNFMPLEVARARIHASNVIRSVDETYSSEDRCSFIKSYDVKFVLAGSNDSSRYKAILDGCKIAFNEVYRTKDLRLFELTN